MSEAFPSNFLKADDIAGREPVVTIKEAALEKLGSGADAEEKLVLSFVESPKKMVVNKTNFDNICKATGQEDSDDWGGHKITITTREVDFQGKTVLALRVSILPPKTAAKAPAKAPAKAAVISPEVAAEVANAGQTEAGGEEGINSDDVPF